MTILFHPINRHQSACFLKNVGTSHSSSKPVFSGCGALAILRRKVGLSKLFGPAASPEATGGFTRSSCMNSFSKPVAMTVTITSSFIFPWITDQPGLALAIAAADCVPILIVDGVQRVIAAAHAGWRGSLMGIATQTVKALSERFGSRTRDLWAGLGPSAGGCCYEVDGVVLDPLKEKFPDWRSVVRERQNGRALLDLHELNHLQLAEAGVPPNQIYRMDTCTICQPDRFHSYRREGREVKTMLSGIVIRQP